MKRLKKVGKRVLQVREEAGGLSRPFPPFLPLSVYLAVPVVSTRHFTAQRHFTWSQIKM